MPNDTRAVAAKPDRYIWRRRETRTIWFRMAVPRAYHAVAGKKVIQRSLETTDIRQARLLAGKLRAELFASWSEPEGESPSLAPFQPSPLDMMTGATECAFDEIRSRIERTQRRANAMNDGVSYAQYLDDLRARMLKLVRTREGEMRPVFEGIADRHIRRANWTLEKGSTAYGAFVDMIAEAAIEALRVTHARASGDLGAQPTSYVVTTAKSAAASAAAAGQTLLELFERYAAQRVSEGVKRADGINQDRVVVALFAEFVGTTRAVDSITVEDARDFIFAAEKLPLHFAKRKAYRGLRMRQAIEKGVRDKDRTISPITHARYVSTVSPFFDWLKAYGFTNLQPFDGLHKHPKKGRNPRPPLSANQINTILESPLFAGFQGERKEHLPGKERADDWRYWIPLLCLFSGARIGEVAQLQVADIVREHDVWFAHLREDENTGQQTKSRKSRIMPIHSKLIAMGFLEFHKRQVARLFENPNPQLFPELKPDKRNQMGAKPSRFWRDYLASIGIKCGADGFGAHSFRHTISDQLRIAGLLDDQFGPIILGHSNKSTTTGYGRLTQGTAAMLSDMIEAVEFRGVEFGHLMMQLPEFALPAK